MGGAIVRLPTEHYRKVAKKHWGLTDEQMAGKHVHHRIPRSKGGTNDPSNLFVCSPWFHAHVWHNESYFTEAASKGGKQCQKLGVGGGDRKIAARGGKTAGKMKTPKQQEARRKSAKKLGESRFVSVTLLHVETGETYYFETCKEACKVLNLSKCSLSLVLNGRRKSHKGFTVLNFERRNKG